MTDKSLRPNKKVQAGINWSAFATVFVGVIAVFYPDAYSRIPPGFELALGALIGSAVANFAAYMKPS